MFLQIEQQPPSGIRTLQNAQRRQVMEVTQHPATMAVTFVMLDIQAAGFLFVVTQTSGTGPIFKVW